MFMIEARVPVLGITATKQLFIFRQEVIMENHFS
jgi:hypothetical protein